eukprot:14795.XXX_689309_689428_1 [CDS] Oithona nana genome sequencing.
MIRYITIIFYSNRFLSDTSLLSSIQPDIPLFKLILTDTN